MDDRAILRSRAFPYHHLEGVRITGDVLGVVNVINYAMESRVVDQYVLHTSGEKVVFRHLLQLLRSRRQSDC